MQCCSCNNWNNSDNSQHKRNKANPWIFKIKMFQVSIYLFWKLRHTDSIKAPLLWHSTGKNAAESLQQKTSSILFANCIWVVPATICAEINLLFSIYFSYFSFVLLLTQFGIWFFMETFYLNLKLDILFSQRSKVFHLAIRFGIGLFHKHVVVF